MQFPSGFSRQVAPFAQDAGSMSRIRCYWIDTLALIRGVGLRHRFDCFTESVFRIAGPCTSSPPRRAGRRHDGRVEKSLQVASAVRAVIRSAAKRAGSRPVGHDLLAAGHGRHRDDDFSSGVFVYTMPDRCSRLAQRVGLIDDRDDLARFKELFEYK